MKVALVHDWLTGMRGGENVLEAIAELYPEAEIFTLVCNPEKISPLLKSHKIHTSLLQKIPGAIEKYRYFLPLMPFLAERFDLSDFDLVISSSHCVAKGVHKSKRAKHISYVHAPMRYMWDRFDEYFGPKKASLPVQWAARLVRPYMRKWDRRVSGENNVDLMISNSRFIAEQIEKAYHRKSIVLNPFANLDRFMKLKTPPEGREGYLVFGAMVPYKRVDLAIEAFNRLKLPLTVIGEGPEEEKLRALAGPTIQFLGPQPNEVINEYYSKSKALIFPGKEDFGIIPVEAMASGMPIIAFGEGGVLDSTTGKTALLFKKQTIKGLCEAVDKFEKGLVQFQEKDCRIQAKEFSKENFQARFIDLVDRTLSD